MFNINLNFLENDSVARQKKTTHSLSPLFDFEQKPSHSNIFTTYPLNRYAKDGHLFQPRVSGPDTGNLQLGLNGTKTAENMASKTLYDMVNGTPLGKVKSDAGFPHAERYSCGDSKREYGYGGKIKIKKDKHNTDAVCRSLLSTLAQYPDIFEPDFVTKKAMDGSAAMLPPKVCRYFKKASTGTLSHHGSRLSQSTKKQNRISR